MKRKISELMAVHKKDGSTSPKTLDRPMLGFRDIEKVGGVLNDIFPLVITATVGHFDLSQILINEGRSCDIMYSNMFKKIRLNKENLWPYEGSYLQAFNDITIVIGGYIKLMIYVG